jgi:xanthine/CO dehydrogenase XdhC/CoxF family maturation factor
MKELLEILDARAARPDLPYALATVVRVRGSSYRQAGARMLIGATGRLAGSVSGGCLERDVMSRGLAVILSGRAQLAVYDTTDQDDLAFGTSLGCEGRIEILIEPVPARAEWPLAEAARAILAQRRPAGVALPYAAGGEPVAGRMMVRVADGKKMEWGGVMPGFTAIEPEIDRVVATKKPRNLSFPGDGKTWEVLLERIAPPQPLILFGGGHDVPPLVRLAKELGHHVTVIDRRPDFAEPQRFPGADRVWHVRPGDVLARVPMDEESAAVIMNHHYETDAELLGELLGTPLAYLGMLGPRRRTEKILVELRESGKHFTAGQMEKLHAPAGLDLGSENPEQIALSILAELQATMAGRSAAHLRNRSGPIRDADEPVPGPSRAACALSESSF